MTGARPRYAARLMPALAALLCVLLAGPVRAATVSGGQYGEVEVFRPSTTLRGFVVLFSDMTGWSAADAAAGRRLAAHGMLVVGVDSERYAAKLATVKEDCHFPVGDAENVSHQLQREMGSHAYFSPIIAGIGEGGALAERVLAIAPSNTLGGAISINPAPTLDARFNPCPPDPTILHDPGLPGFWSIGATTRPAAPVRARAEQVRHEGGRVTIRDFAPGTDEGAMLLALAEPHLGARAPDEQDVSDLPLVLMPAKSPGAMLAIVVSGDGGWRDLDKTIAQHLQDWGVSVVGIDSLRYFWNKKTPRRTADDLARVIRTYTARWHAGSVALVGYSFGADVLPFAYNRLDPAVRDKVALMALLGFAPAADFEIRVTGWLGLPPSAEALPVAGEIAKVPPALVQCFYGAEESDTICPSLTKYGMRVIRTAGGHHFGAGYEPLARQILDRWKARMARPD
ncbi:MAG: virulence factor family protein [Rhodospirillales bacterium]|nr:virulence factor family protein [Rhodospirillales bacterium]